MRNSCFAAGRRRVGTAKAELILQEEVFNGCSFYHSFNWSQKWNFYIGFNGFSVDCSRRAQEVFNAKTGTLPLNGKGRQAQTG